LPRNRNRAPATATSASRPVTSWPPGTITGFAGVIRSPISLPEAISEPVNVIEPITTSSTVATFSSRTGAPVSRRYSLIAISAAAPPPTALNSDTSCGIAVIGTVRAAYSP
jgi:hypothetical protein